MLTQHLRRMLIWLSPFIMAAGLSYLGLQIAQNWGVVTVDVKFFCLAGELWRAGANPYGPDFAAEMSAQFAVTHVAGWYYTPNWFFLSTFLSLFDPLACSRI